MQKVNVTYSFSHRFAAWSVHAFTALTAVVGFITLVKINDHQYIQAIWLIGIAILIDAVDGTLARLVNIKSVLPNIDGALLDNMVDYLNYVITPMFFLYIKPDMLPESCRLLVVSFVIFTSAYQFCQSDAKTPDHFFKGFPCYWNICLFYFFIFESSALTNAAILIILSVLVFVPIKYVYPSRLKYLTESNALRTLMHAFSALFGISLAILLLQYPNTSSLWLGISFAYAVVYILLSVYRTCYPLIKSKLLMKRGHEHK